MHSFHSTLALFWKDTKGIQNHITKHIRIYYNAYFCALQHVIASSTFQQPNSLITWFPNPRHIRLSPHIRFSSHLVASPRSSCRWTWSGRSEQVGAEEPDLRLLVPSVPLIASPDALCFDRSHQPTITPIRKSKGIPKPKPRPRPSFSIPLLSEEGIPVAFPVWYVELMLK
jgi:hypothetical protein